MACSFPSSSATRLQLQAVDAAKAPFLLLRASVSPSSPRSLGSCCRATRQEFGGATKDPNVSVAQAANAITSQPKARFRRNFLSSLFHLFPCYYSLTQQVITDNIAILPSVVSSARTRLDLLEQLTSSSPTGQENGDPTVIRPRATIREQLSAVYGERGGEFTLPLGKKLKEGLKSLNSLTVSQRRNIKRQALLTRVSGRNDSVFFATVGAFVLVPPFAILAIAVLNGNVQLLP